MSLTAICVRLVRISTGLLGARERYCSCPTHFPVASDRPPCRALRGTGRRMGLPPNRSGDTMLDSEHINDRPTCLDAWRETFGAPPPKHLSRWCQTNSNQSQLAAKHRNLCRTKLAPLSKSGANFVRHKF